MKRTELMIGDWVFVHKPTCKGHRVDYINEMEEEIGADGEIYDVCDIRPIPLTTEILEKNGWRWNEYKLLFIADEHDMPTLRWGYDEECENLWWFKHLGPIARVKYVHELQHALRLCGIEKSIEL